MISLPARARTLTTGSIRRRSAAAVAVGLGLGAGALACIPFVPGVAGLLGGTAIMAFGGVALAVLERPVAAGLLLMLGGVLVPWVGVATPEGATSSVFELCWLFAALGSGAIVLEWPLLLAAGALNLGVFGGLLLANPAIEDAAVPPSMGMLGLVTLMGVVHALQRGRVSQAIDRKEAQLEEALAEARRRADEAEQAREELAAAQALLMRSAKLAALGELSATVAHEVNNPLVSVSLGAAELGELHADPGSQEAVQSILEGVRRCKAVVQRLLSFARRNEAGRVRTDLAALTARTVGLVQRHLEQRGARVRATVEGPLWVEGDVDELEQVVMNLLLNAGDALGGRGEIRVESGREGDHVWVQVADDGPGIPEQIRDRIFEPFFTTHPEDGGTGLGLAISHRIVTGHAGTLSAVSRPGAGTRFVVRLPAAAA